METKANCELTIILKNWVKENNLPVDITNGGWITWDLGKHVVGSFTCTYVRLYGFNAPVIPIGDPDLFQKLYTGIKIRTDYLKNRSWLRKWLEDPGD